MKISVVTATHNRKDLLWSALRSVELARLEPLHDVLFEHIVVDDGSTDGTHTLFSTDTDATIHYHQMPSSRGQSAALNEAIRHATGDYIFILDDDDIMLQRTLHNFAKEALLHPDTGWFVSDFLRVDSEVRYLPGEDYFGWEFDTPESMLEAIFHGEHFIQHNVFFSKKLFDEAGGFDEDVRLQKTLIAEDLDLWIRFLLAGHMPRHCNFISHLHRFHGGNISASITPERHRETALELRKKYRR